MTLIIHRLIHFCLALNFGFFLFIIYTRPLRLTNLEFKSLFFNDLSELAIFIIIKFFIPNKQTYIIFQIYFSIIFYYFIFIGQVC